MFLCCVPDDAGIQGKSAVKITGPTRPGGRVGAMSSETSYVMITGTSAGIGAEFARQYVTAGYNLVLTARRAKMLEDLAG